jgi:hypothetical protein
VTESSQTKKEKEKEKKKKKREGLPKTRTLSSF